MNGEDGLATRAARNMLSTMMAALLSVLLTTGAMAQDLPRRTALDDYVEKPDASYSWTIKENKTADGMRTVLIDMVSQTWRTTRDVNRTEWRHWLTLSIPEGATSDVAMLFISGGYNGEGPRSNKRTETIAKATGAVVAQLGMVPNQTLIFHNDGKERREDDLVAYTWDQFLKTGDPTWPARNPMVKSAVRAMDTITAVMATKEVAGRVVNRFVVAGGSKRGWTTWLTGAVDRRVIGIIPIVIDVLNTDVSMRHHFASYGFWAPNVGDYVSHRVMQRLGHPRMRQLLELVDPYYYRHRLTMPKLILNAAGDQFFLPDSSRFYWDDLRGENYLRYVPNGDHGLDETDAAQSIIAFYWLLLNQKKPPVYQWTKTGQGELVVMAKDKPVEARLWQAHNPEARDFRVETLGRKYTSTVIRPDKDGLYRAKLTPPDRGWTAYLIELTYAVGGPAPLKLTTNVNVVPDTLPFADKPSDLPTSVTLVCRAPSETVARQVADRARTLAKSQSFTANGLTAQIRGRRCYFNWVPAGDFKVGAELLTKFLAGQKCGAFAYQLESGTGITFPPAASK